MLRSGVGKNCVISQRYILSVGDTGKLKKAVLYLKVIIHYFLEYCTYGLAIIFCLVRNSYIQ